MNYKCVIVILITSILVRLVSGNESLIVNTPQGAIRGYEKISVLNGAKYYSFTSIPYAKPPVGNLRFQPPVPADKWNGTLNAEKEGDARLCLQVIGRAVPGQTKFLGDENCLYLNVFTPQPPSEIKNLKTVMVWIPGGGFEYGGGSTAIVVPDYIILYDVVIVFINYRLDVLGFLNMGIPSARGNAGLKDQVLALKWVQQNIRQFGGDPKKVTLAGLSSGGASANYHILSPLSQGLFQRAIMESGYGLSAWAINPKPIEWGLELARILGYCGNNREEVVQFLQSLDQKNVIEGAVVLQDRNTDVNHALLYPFPATVELIKEGAFLPERPEVLFKTVRNVSVMSGFDIHEGTISLDSGIIPILQKNFAQIIKYYFGGVNGSRLNVIAENVKKYFFGNKQVSNDTIFELLNMFDNFATLRFYEAMEKISDAPYLYQFVHKSDMNIDFKQFLQKVQLDQKGPFEPGHGDEFEYLFYLPHDVPAESIKNIKPDDLQVIRYMCSLWTNFAKTGNPSYNTDIKWLPSTKCKPAYLKISSNLKMAAGQINGKARSFMYDLFKKENLTIQASDYLFNIIPN